MKTPGLTPAIPLTLLCLAVGCADAGDEGTEIPVATAENPDARREARENPLPSETGIGGFAVGESPEDTTRVFDAKLQMNIPALWLDAELTAMQRSVLLAKFEIPDVDRAIEITVSSASGGIDGNFRRWEGQFTNSTKDEDKIDVTGAVARVLILTGDYHPGFGKPDGPGYTMMGAAIPADGRDFYVKLTGPKDKVKQIDRDFRAMIKSAELLP